MFAFFFSPANISIIDILESLENSGISQESSTFGLGLKRNMFLPLYTAQLSLHQFLTFIFYTFKIC